ncbi:MAG: chromate efflux transporter [Rhizobiaceae bacterium]|nr:chromate efflux transporter [Rhizobiaceae bacterium]
MSGKDLVMPSRFEMFHTFGRIGILSFGGPAAQIALMHKVLVDEKAWLTEKQYLNALSFCMLLPGPEAMQLATYAGWRITGVFGGLLAGLLFVLPGAFVILALASIYAYFGDIPLIAALFLGVKATVLIIVIEALLKVSKRALKQNMHWVMAAIAFVGIFFLSLPFPLIVSGAGLYGFIFVSHQATGDKQPAKLGISDLRRSVRTIAIWLAIWILPLLVLDQLVEANILNVLAAFFSKLAVVTFGGAYAVLAYMAQDVVAQFGWLSAGEMMDGLGLAETTPGPLILVTEFVGFLAAFKEGGFWLGVLGAIVTLWVTFVPCFLWIFTGAPYIEWISAQPRLSSALSMITAAVVGVILNLSIWFGLHVFFQSVTRESVGILTLWVPDIASLDWRVFGLSALAALLLLKLKIGLLKVLAICAILGLVLSIAF